jgi:hypothetical protein
MNTQMVRSMISAEFLKLRRRRALFWWSLVLTSGVVIAAYTTMLILHASDAVKYGPAGGLSNYGDLVQALTAFCGVASIMIGATAGGGDLGAGVFRDMASTGRSRFSLFLVRVPGALLLQLPLVLGAFALATIGAFAFAAGTPTPDAGLVVHYGVWLLAGAILDLVLGIALASLIGSRATTVGILLAWEAIAVHILAHLSFLGGVRDVLNSTALDQLRPGGGQEILSMPLAAAVVVLIGWVVVALAAGAWRTHTIDA